MTGAATWSISIPDVIASTANNFKIDGWVSGQSWGYEVVLPPNFDYLLADRSRQMTMRQWQDLGVKRAGVLTFPRLGERAYLLLPAGARGPAFLMLPNFHVIMKYNPAEAYALAIGHLADRLRGGGPLVQSWPRDERALTIAERYELQQLLARRGFDVGEPDGLLGPRSRIAIRNFQASSGQTPDGFASSVRARPVAATVGTTRKSGCRFFRADHAQRKMTICANDGTILRLTIFGYYEVWTARASAGLSGKALMAKRNWRRLTISCALVAAGSALAVPAGAQFFSDRASVPERARPQQVQLREFFPFQWWGGERGGQNAPFFGQPAAAAGRLFQGSAAA